MKRIISLVLALTMIFAFSACGGAAITDTADRGTVKVYVDGVETVSFSVEDFAKKTTEKEIDSTNYYGKALADILGDKANVSELKAAFTKSADGYAAYFSNISDMFVATYKADDAGELKSITDDSGNAGFTLVSAEAKAKQVSEIYLLTDAQDWEAKISVYGEEKILTISDFMAMNPKYETLNHKYNGGTDVFEGEFLCVDSKTLMEYAGVSLVEGNNDDGSAVYYAEHTLLSFMGGVQSSSSDLAVEKNTDLKSSPFVEKTGWLVYYFVLVNGNDYHDIVGADLDLSCIRSGTGIRWMCTPLESIALEKSDEVKW